LAVQEEFVNTEVEGARQIYFIEDDVINMLITSFNHNELAGGGI
jgi:hypothetical protein